MLLHPQQGHPQPFVGAVRVAGHLSARHANVLLNRLRQLLLLKDLVVAVDLQGRLVVLGLVAGLGRLVGWLLQLLDHLIGPRLDGGAVLVQLDRLAVAAVEFLEDLVGVDLAGFQQVDDLEARLGLLIVRGVLERLLIEPGRGFQVLLLKRHLGAAQHLILHQAIGLVGEGQGAVGADQRGLVLGVGPLLDHADQEVVFQVGLGHRVGDLGGELARLARDRSLNGRRQLLGRLHLADHQGRGVAAQGRQLGRVLFDHVRGQLHLGRVQDRRGQRLQ